MTQGSGVSIKKKKSGLWIYKLHTVKFTIKKKKKVFAHAVPSAWNSLLPRSPHGWLLLILQVSAQISPPPRSPPDFPCIINLSLVGLL